MPLTFIVKMVTANAEANISAGSLYDSSDTGRPSLSSQKESTTMALIISKHYTAIILDRAAQGRAQIYLYTSFLSLSAYLHHNHSWRAISAVAMSFLGSNLFFVCFTRRLE